VEPEVNPYDNDHPQVTPHGDKINKEKHDEKYNLLVEIICEA
jgi:hemerythrin superfamily protein